MSKGAIGVIGGMGPEASSYMFSILIDLAAKEFGAKTGDQFPEIILDSVPVPDFFADEKNYEVAKKMLIERVKKLNSLDLSCLSLACNTAHLLLPELQQATTTPFISMVQGVVDKVVSEGIKVIGLVGSPTTLRTKLYQTPLENLNIRVIVPEENEIMSLEDIIKNVIDKTSSKKDTEVLEKIIENLITKGAEAIILGCTELPLVYSQNSETKVYNSVTILAESLLKKYYGD